MERWQNRVAVVTGASSGIGAACVKLIATAGVKVVGLARRVDRMEQLRSTLSPAVQHNFQYRQCDVTEEQQVNTAFEWIEHKMGGTDILINNAGIIRDGCLIEMSTKTLRNVIDTNLIAAIYCTQNAFKSMNRRNFDGHLIFINSTAGLNGYNPGPKEPSLNVYTPTKCALNAVNEICRQELMTLKRKIKTTNISPGWVSTEIVSDAIKVELGDVILQPEDVAQAVLYALSTPPNVQVQEVTLRAVGEWH